MSTPQHPDLRRYAYTIAGPRDLIINVLINGTIAWFLYHSAEQVAVTGAESMFSMILPMTFIEGSLTTFFGVLSGFHFLRRKQAPPGKRDLPAWLKRAVTRGLICAGIAGGGAVLVMLVLRAALPDTNLTSTVTIGIITSWSGVLAFALHSRAVISAGQHRGAERPGLTSGWRTLVVMSYFSSKLAITMTMALAGPAIAVTA